MDKKSIRIIGIFDILREKNDLSLKEIVSLYKESYAGMNEVSEKEDYLERSFRRYMKEMVENGYVLESSQNKLVKGKANVYRINWSKFVETKDVDNLLTALLFCGEHQAYQNIRDYLSLDNANTFNDMELEKYKRSVKEDVTRINVDPDIYKCINKALDNEEFIYLTYKGKKQEAYPIGYIVGRDGLRTYLYYLRKKELQQCDVSYITSAVPITKPESEREKYRKLKNEHKERLQKIWDVGYQKEEIPLRLKVLKNHMDSEKVMDELDNMQSFCKVLEEETGDIRIYKGTIIGEADFTSWIRTHIDTCIVMEPLELRERIKKALFDKMKRYGE